MKFGGDYENSCCYGCNNRSQRCHSYCLKYIQEAENTKAKRKEREKDYILDSFRYECVMKTKRRLQI